MKQEAQGQPCYFFFQDAWGLDCILSNFFMQFFSKELLNVEVLNAAKLKQFKVKINSSFPHLPEFLIFGFSIHAYHEIYLIAF